MRVWGTIVAICFGVGACTDTVPAERAGEIPLRVADAPLTHIDGGRSEVIEYLQDATRLASGVVVLVDQYASALHFFAPDGSYLRTTGSRGDGPGEFGNPMWIDQCGVDSLFVWDYTKRAVVVTDTAGTFVREFRPAGAPHQVACGSPNAWLMLGIPSEFVQPGADGARPPADLWVADGTGAMVAALGEVPFGENRALGLLTRIAAGPGGLYVGTADSAWVDVYTPTGAESEGVGIGAPGRSPTAAEYERAIEAMISVSPSPRARERARAQYSEIPMPAATPPYRELLLDQDGLLWAVVSPAGAPSTDLRSTERGEDRGLALSLPSGFEVLQLGSDFVLGLLTDSLGIQSPTVYGLERGPR